MTSVTFGGTAVAAEVTFFSQHAINDILKYFQNNSYFTKPNERATKLNVLLNKERSKQQ